MKTFFLITAILFTHFTLQAESEPQFPSYKYVDLTLEKWPTKDDPPISISNMEIFANYSLNPNERDQTNASWTKKTNRGLECHYYDINFQIEDRHGNTILKETKFYSYPKGGGSRDKFNKDRRNVVFSGPDHSARFTKKFHKKLYLTIKYWVSNVKCKKYVPRAARRHEPDRIAFPLKEQLKKAKEK